MKITNEDSFDDESRKTLANEMREADTLFVVIGLLAVIGALVTFGIATLIAAF